MDSVEFIQESIILIPRINLILEIELLYFLTPLGVQREV